MTNTTQNTIVAKFGGSSLSDAHAIRKVIQIIRSNPDRKCIVVSAPGKRFSLDQKVTDLLILWHQHPKGPYGAQVKGRFTSIINELLINYPDFEDEFLRLEVRVAENQATLAVVISRGEYFMARILAIALGYSFIDSFDLIVFDKNNQHSVRNINMLQRRNIVVPGFYGVSDTGTVQTFSRGGSDITGALLAQALKANMYENWTDVSGVYMADPRIVKNPQPIRVMTYTELHELAATGANVFHQEAVFPVQDAGIPTWVKNTNHPNHPGTCIITSYESDNTKSTIGVTGISGQQGFTSITIQKRMMHSQIGFVAKILTVFAEKSISFEHMPSGADTVSFIIKSNQPEEKLESVLTAIREKCNPDEIKTRSDIALISIVGQGMINRVGVVAKLLTRLANENINIVLIDQGASQMTVNIGVANDDYGKAICTIYDEVVSKCEVR